MIQTSVTKNTQKFYILAPFQDLSFWWSGQSRMSFSFFVQCGSTLNVLLVCHVAKPFCFKRSAVLSASLLQNRFSFAWTFTEKNRLFIQELSQMHIRVFAEPKDGCLDRRLKIPVRQISLVLTSQWAWLHQCKHAILSTSTCMKIYY